MYGCVTQAIRLACCVCPLPCHSHQISASTNSLKYTRCSLCSCPSAYALHCVYSHPNTAFTYSKVKHTKYSSRPPFIHTIFRSPIFCHTLSHAHYSHLPLGMILFGCAAPSTPPPGCRHPARVSTKQGAQLVGPETEGWDDRELEEFSVCGRQRTHC